MTASEKKRYMSMGVGAFLAAAITLQDAFTKNPALGWKAAALALSVGLTGWATRWIAAHPDDVEPTPEA